MASSALNYDPLAPAYHGRYAVNPLPGTAAALHGLVQSLAARRVLEVGCGTGRWLDELKGEAAMVGLDFSPGMLARARA
jgi:SAM-dependent methyltransferase